MSDLYSDQQLVYAIEAEGLGYAVMFYLNPNNIANEDTKVLWVEAARALNKLAKHLRLPGYETTPVDFYESSS